MLETRRSGVRIHYHIEGRGAPVVLIHGYTASGWSNWVAPGWVERLANDHTLIVPDLRGHGRSEKPPRAEAYSRAAFASDVVAVMDEEGVERAPIVGYSMGGMVALELLGRHTDRIERAVIGGMGSYFPKGRSRFAFELRHPRSLAPPRGPLDYLAQFARYATELDPVALNGVFQSVFRDGVPVDPGLLPAIEQPVLVAAGTRDVFFESAVALARSLPNARFLPVPHDAHISTLRNPRFIEAAAAFLREPVATT
jgi:pimeloyl-ACP methyl ester carboxylesterase